MGKRLMLGLLSLVSVGVVASEAEAGRASVARYLGRIVVEGATYDAMKYGARRLSGPQPQQNYGAPLRGNPRSPFDMRVR